MRPSSVVASVFACTGRWQRVLIVQILQESAALAMQLSEELMKNEAKNARKAEAEAEKLRREQVPHTRCNGFCALIMTPSQEEAARIQREAAQKAREAEDKRKKEEEKVKEAERKREDERQAKVKRQQDEEDRRREAERKRAEEIERKRLEDERRLEEVRQLKLKRQQEEEVCRLMV